MFEPLLVVFTVYNWPSHVAVSIFTPLLAITVADLLLNDTLAPLSPSFNTKIKFDLKSGVCRAPFKVICHGFPSTIDSNLTFPFPIIWKVESRPAPKPVVGLLRGEYTENKTWSVRQWSLALESSSVSIGDLVWDLVPITLVLT